MCPARWWHGCCWRDSCPASTSSAGSSTRCGAGCAKARRAFAASPRCLRTSTGRRDRAHRLVLTSSAMPGGARAAAMGKRRWEIPSLTPDARGLARASRGARCAPAVPRLRALAPRAIDGAERHVTISGDPVFDAAGRLHRVSRGRHRHQRAQALRARVARQRRASCASSPTTFQR